jgi:GH25 family lysozyme M1 (1,4-beta-N-acetylmuramidase)
MRFTLGAWHRLVSTAAAGIVSSTLLFGLTGTPDVAAEPGRLPANAGVTHPDADHAGSEIAKREGVADPPGQRPNVARTAGLDVSAFQGSVNWASVVAKGARFAYVKATEGTGYTNPSFAQQYNGSYQAGLIRGAYHFALPNVSDGPTQADYFVNHGGGWSPDGKTLPPMLDAEYNPYGSTCYGLSQAAMRSWLRAFSDRVHTRTGRYPTVYTSTTWWTECTGNWPGLGSTNPLFIARYASSPGTLPAGWAYWTFWQFADSGVFPGDQDSFNGAADRLRVLANG